MAFKATIPAIGQKTGQSTALIMPAGTLATDHVLIAVAIVEPISGALPVHFEHEIFYKMVVPMRSDFGINWTMFDVWGVPAGDHVIVTFDVQVTRFVQGWVFDTELGARGPVGSRSVEMTPPANYHTDIPGQNALPGSSMLVFAVEKDDLSGTGIAAGGVGTTTGDPVNQLSWAEDDGFFNGGGFSFYLGEFTPTTDPAFSPAWVTYDYPGDGAGVQISANAALEATSTFKSASDPVSGATDTPLSLVMPAGTVPGDHVLVAAGVDQSYADINLFDTYPPGDTVRREMIRPGGPHRDRYLSWSLSDYTGVKAGDVIGVRFYARPTSVKYARAWVFSAPIGENGGVGIRSHWDDYATWAPGRSMAPGAKVLVFAIDRATPGGSMPDLTYTSAGEGLARLGSYGEADCLALQLYEFTAVDNPSGNAYLVYDWATLNALAVQIAEVAGTESVPQPVGPISPCRQLYRSPTNRPSLQAPDNRPTLQAIANSYRDSVQAATDQTGDATPYGAEIYAVDPPQIDHQAGTFTLTVTGDCFIKGFHQIYFDGVPQTTIYVSDQILVATGVVLPTQISGSYDAPVWVSGAGAIRQLRVN